MEGQARAEAFVAYLLTLNVSTHVEQVTNAPTTWEIWIRDEDKIPLAQEELKEYESNPEDVKYLQAVKDARTILLEQRDQARSRVRNVTLSRNIARNSMLSGSVPGLTLTIIVLCSILSLLSEFSAPAQDNLIGISIDRQLMFADLNLFVLTGDPLCSIKQGQVWRLFTPMFLHGSALHLIMNMLALASLGRITERLERMPRYFFLILVFALGAHLLQALLPANMFGISGLSGGPSFVGASGVIMGLFGYVATKTNLRPDLRFTMSMESYFMIGLIFVLGFAGSILGKQFDMHIANFAHLGGLLAGIAMGFVFSNRRFDRA